MLPYWASKFDEDFDIGLEGEELLRQIALAYAWRQEEKLEVKNDVLVSDTGNVFVEREFKDRPSGIETSPARWWAFVADGEGYKREVIILIKASRLKEICKKHRVVKGGNGKRSRGYIIPIRELVSKLEEVNNDDTGGI